MPAILLDLHAIHNTEKYEQRQGADMLEILMDRNVLDMR